MFALKTGLATFLIVLGLSSSAPAQQVFGPFGNRGFGYSSGYYGGYGNYPGYGGRYNYSPYRYQNVPQTYNNMGGLMNAITQQTGPPGSWRTNSNYGVSRNRRFR